MAKSKDGSRGPDSVGTDAGEGQVVERFTVESDTVKGGDEYIEWIEDSQGEEVIVSAARCAAALNTIERVKALLDGVEAEYAKASSSLLLADLIHISTVRKALVG